MYVLSLLVDLHLPAARSLKEKRMVVKSIVDGARHKFRVAAAEVGYLDQWQRAELGFAVVSGSERQAVAVVDELDRFIWSRPEIEVLSVERRWSE
jgi:uncharacterized protein YlxP (DUF503 family)